MRNKALTRSRAGNFTAFLFLMIFGIFIALPMYYSIINAFKPISELFLFPTRDGHPTSFVMDSKTPYMECSVGIHNIFKILHIDYVRRLNYLDNPGANKWGIRLMVMMTF